METINKLASNVKCIEEAESEPIYHFEYDFWCSPQLRRILCPSTKSFCLMQYISG